MHDHLFNSVIQNLIIGQQFIGIEKWGYFVIDRHFLSET